MSMIRTFTAGCALSLAALSPLDTANAVNLGVPAIALEKQTDVIQAQIACDFYGCYPGWRPPYYGPRYYGPRYDGPRYYGPRYYAPRYYRPRPVYRPYRGYSRHVRWCLNRYRTYNPATNRYIGTGGVYRICYSPWR